MNKKVFVILCIITFCFNVGAIFIQQAFSFRIIRFTFSILYFLIYLRYRKQKNKIFFYAILCIILSEFFIVFYEKHFSPILTSSAKGLGYILLTLYIKNHINFKKIDKFMYVVLAILILGNFYSLYKIINYLQGIPAYYFPISIIAFHGLTLIFCCFFAGINNLSKSSKSSLSFSILVFALALSDLSIVPSYFMRFDIFTLFDRIFYTIALCYLLKYTVMGNEVHSTNPS